MRANYARRWDTRTWAVCEGCDTHVPTDWFAPSERDGEPLCRECRAQEHAEDEARDEREDDCCGGGGCRACCGGPRWA